VAKRDHIAKQPIADLFMPVLDTDVRNGIGHHAAHYEQDPDAIVIFDTKDAGTISRVMGYTEFCEKVLELFAAFELAAVYPHDLHITSKGDSPERRAGRSGRLHQPECPPPRHRQIPPVAEGRQGDALVRQDAIPEGYWEGRTGARKSSSAT
jgi:hypothetical protein